ncbi:MAG: helix-hairpin-helix domain-containing protein, partial [Salinibacter sp.]|uniref:ComEA family DNA-binding protein n=1 Tax=Salinibacter sp. TaxID=2065818 RepID=UPI002FC2AE0D
RAAEAGVQGGRFESWLYLRSRPDYVERPRPDIEVVSLNEAGPEALITLPGVGETIAERIIAFREEREAPITDPYQLTEVSGLTENQIEQWRGLVDPALEPSD